ncbi:MAG: hypothetical protein QOG67_2932 [Verrucomicrobiota bacterium]
MNRLRVALFVALMAAAASLFGWSFTPLAENGSRPNRARLMMTRIPVAGVSYSAVAPQPIYLAQGASSSPLIPLTAAAANGPTATNQSNPQSGDAQTIIDHSPKVLMLVRSNRSFDGDIRHLPPPKARKIRPEKPEHEPPDADIYLPGASAPIGSGSAPAAALSAPAPTPGNSFEGIHFTETCNGGQCGDGHPPDTNGDVGPSYYIQTVNTAIGIYDKGTGARVAGFTFNNLMSQGNFGNLCDTDNFGDPVVLYDTFNDRWIITDFAFIATPTNAIQSPPGAFQCFAVSKSGDPVAGGWNYYSIAVSDALHDYPKLGVWPDGIYMSANMFGYAANSTFNNVRVWAFNKAQMYAGNPGVQVVSFDAPSKISGVSVFTMLPSNARAQAGTPPSGSPNYFASVWGLTNTVRVWKFHADWNNTANSTFTGPTNVTTSGTWASPPKTVPEKDGNNLDSLGPRLMVQNQYSNIGGAESLWNSHAVQGSSTSQAAVRWYQIGVTGGTVAANTIQSATWNPDSKNRWIPSVAVDHTGNMAIGYSVSDSTTYPAIRYAGRLSSDPANTLGQTETSMIEGTGAQTGTFSDGTVNERWGDYSGMSLDLDGCTFWYTNEYYVSNGADDHSRIGSFKFPQCTPLATGTLQGTVKNSSNAGINGATVRIGNDSAMTDANGFYSFPSYAVGTYNVTAGAPGYSSSTANNIVISQNTTTTQNFTLPAAPASACLTDTLKADFDAGTASSVDTSTSVGSVKLTLVAGAETLDQQQTQTSSFGLGSDYEAQTFQAGLSGPLTKAEVYLSTSNTAAITVGIFNTSSGVPIGSALATTTLIPSASAQYFTATFSSPTTVTAGTTYALVLFRSGGSSWIVCSNGGNNCTSTYANGNAYTSSNGTSWTLSTTKQTVFKTYVAAASTYASSGNLISSLKDANPAAGSTAKWTMLSWTATIPASTSLQFQAAAGNSSSGPFNFIGPDGTAVSFFTTSGASLSQFNGFRYLKYKVILNTSNSGSTPTLSDVTVCYDNSQLTVTSLVANSASGTYGGTTNLSGTLTAGGNGVSGKTISFTLNGSPVGTAMTNGSGVASLSNVSLANINAGTYASGAAASFAGDSTYATSGGTNSLTINQANQTIAFGALSNKTYGDPDFTVSATASSGLTVSFAAAGQCTVNGTTVHLTAAGSCTITASQAGDSNYTAATPVDQSFTIAGIPQIAVEEPAGTDLTSGTSLVDFGGVAPGGNSSHTFIIRNDGSGDLTGVAITVDGTNAGDFSLTTSPDTSIAPGQMTSFAVKFAPEATGVRSAALHIASNDGQHNPFDVGLSGTEYTFSEAWRVQYFGSPENSGNGADTTDFEHDGLTNLLEFATGSDPTQPSTMPGSLIRNGDTLEFTYDRAIDAVDDGIIFNVEWRDDLSLLDWSGAGVTEQVLSDNGKIQVVKASVAAGNTGHRFLHLKVTRP